MNNNKADNAGVITIPPFIYIIGLIAGLLIHYFYPSDFLPEAIAIWIGVPLMLVAFPIAVMAFKTFKQAENDPDVRTPTTTIVTVGVYRLSRNPMYLSLAILYLGISCWVNSLWCLLLVLPVLIVVHEGVIKREEKYLEKKFGDAYLQYKSKVRRWI